MTKQRQDSNRGQGLYLAVAAAAIAFLGVVYGVASSYFKLPPGPALTEAMRAAEAQYRQQFSYREAIATNLYFRSRRQEQGVTVLNEAAMEPGLTLYASSHEQSARLIDASGELVWKWDLPFADIWPDNPTIALGPEFISYRRPKLMPNGDLLVVFSAQGVTPYGQGLARISKDSELIWKYSRNVHHDLDVGPDGRVYTLTHEIRPENFRDVRRLKGPRLDDGIAVLSADGEEIVNFSILDAFVDSPWERLPYFIPSNPLGDYIHANSIQVITPELARAHPYAKAGQVLVNLREIRTILVIDVDTQKVVWALEGPWRQQHDVDMLPNGELLIFDNMGNMGPGGATRVVQFRPDDLAITWQYTGEPDNLFYSSIRGSQQRQPNGNTLITESDQGRIFEVTPDGEIVWEYLNPVRAGANDALVPVVVWGERYKPEALPFLNES